MSKLTVRKVETAQGPARLLDEHGLYLRVSPRGAKMWIQRLTIRGRRTDNGIGHYPAMGLAEARAAAFERWMRIPVKPITDSGVKPITESGQADHLSERSDAGVRLWRFLIGLGQ